MAIGEDINGLIEKQRQGQGNNTNINNIEISDPKLILFPVKK